MLTKQIRYGTLFRHSQDGSEEKGNKKAKKHLTFEVGVRYTKRVRLSKEVFEN